MECSEYNCKKPAEYETTRSDRTYSGTKRFCTKHFTEKVSRYPLNAKKLNT